MNSKDPIRNNSGKSEQEKKNAKIKVKIFLIAFHSYNFIIFDNK